MTIQREYATDFLRIVNGPESRSDVNYDSDGEASDMGLFGKGKASDGAPNLAFPQGQAPPAGDSTSIHTFLVHGALSKTGNSTIPSEDVSSYIDAMYAHALGIQEGDQIIAWGPATIRTPQEDKDRAGTVAITRETMLAWWQPGRMSLIHTFQANHSGVTAVEPLDRWASMVQWQVAEYADNRGEFLVGDPVVQLAARFSKDGHENRRALTWFETLMYLLDTGAGPAPSTGGTTGGLGSGGTKL